MATNRKAGYNTHEVLNQPPPLAGINFYDRDKSLQQLLKLGGAEWAEPRVWEYGGLCGGTMIETGFAANNYPPTLQSHDQFGHRLDRVCFHPTYHQLMDTAIGSGWPSLPWAEPRLGAHVARAAMEYLHHHADSGSGCPLTMSFAALPVIRKQPKLAALWEPLLIANRYDGSDAPYFKKPGLTLGMGLTEKQGGTDVQANTTTAEFETDSPLGACFRLTGHKWFLSAPMSDGFLVLAKTSSGLSCFLLPRWDPEGNLNHIHIQRLKTKLGNHSNASAEVEFNSAFGWLIGEEGRGVATVIEMVALTRFDCMVGSTALMRRGLIEALHHCSHRQVFGKPLIHQPLMTNVLADLALEQEAALTMTMRIARALDCAHNSDHERGLVRLGTAVGKFWICKRANSHLNETMECLGGNGYVEESVLPRLYREGPVNSIWEGSGNVQCLDALRTIRKDSGCLEALLAEIQLARGADRRFDNYLKKLDHSLADNSEPEFHARILLEQLALAFQASLLLQGNNGAAADLFCASRLDAGTSGVYGSLPNSAQCASLIAHSWSPD